MADSGANIMLIASIMPANAKFARKNDAQHFRNAFNDFAPNATRTIDARNRILMTALRKTGIFSIKMTRENTPPRPAARRKRTGLN